MALDTFALLAAIYNSEDAAIADYDAVHELYTEADLIDTYDAAVITRTDKGKVKIVKKHEQPLRQGAWVGGGLGLATGLCVALFPAVALGAGLAWGAGIGAGLGALAGHAAGGMSRSDLKDLGETLDNGECAMVAVAAAAIADRVEAGLERADKVERKELKADPAAVKDEVAQAATPVS